MEKGRARLGIAGIGLKPSAGFRHIGGAKVDRARGFAPRQRDIGLAAFHMHQLPAKAAVLIMKDVKDAGLRAGHAARQPRQRTLVDASRVGQFDPISSVQGIHATDIAAAA